MYSCALGGLIGCVIKMTMTHNLTMDSPFEFQMSPGCYAIVRYNYEGTTMLIYKNKKNSVELKSNDISYMIEVQAGENNTVRLIKTSGTGSFGLDVVIISY